MGAQGDRGNNNGRWGWEEQEALIGETAEVRKGKSGEDCVSLSFWCSHSRRTLCVAAIVA